MVRFKEVCKFLCGLFTHEALVHTALYAGNVSFTVFGMKIGETHNIAGAVVSGLLAIITGVYAWRRPR